MFLHRFFGHLARDCNFEYYSPNLAEPNLDKLEQCISNSFCCCPIRSFEARPAGFQNMDDVSRIFHVRDPRDILVSEYFSVGWIHDEICSALAEWRKQVQQMTIDQYVLERPNLGVRPLSEMYLPLLQSPLGKDRPSATNSNGEHVLLVRYEDMVTVFDRWLGMVIRPFSFTFPQRRVRQYRRKYAKEFVKTGESMTHRRRVTPGDYLDKLKPSTIGTLNRRFADVLSRFGYTM